MLGWLQNGGGINKYFNETRLSDVLLCTEQSNNIVIGNLGPGLSNAGNAAIYIQNNAIGVNCVPTIPDIAFDVAGNVRVKTGYTVDADNIISNKLSLSSNCLMTSNGLISTSNTVATTLPYRRITDSVDAFVYSIDLINNVIELDFTYKPRFHIESEGGVMNINNISYSILKSDIIDFLQNRYRFRLRNEITNVTLNDSITVHFYKQLPDTVTEHPIKVPIQIIQAIYSTTDVTTMTMYATVLDTTYLSHFLDNTVVVMFASSSQKHIYLMKNSSYDWNTSIFTATIRSIDNVSDISESVPMYLSSLYVDIYYTHAHRETTSITENDIAFGRYLTSGQEVSITFTTTTILSTFANTRDNRLNGLDSLTLSFGNSPESYSVNAFYREHVFNRLVVNVRGLSSIPVCGTTNISYVFVGTSIPVISSMYGQQGGSIIYEYGQNDALFDIFKMYNLLYIIDSWYTGVWKVVHVDKCNNTVELQPDDAAIVSIDVRALSPRTIFAIPFNIKYQCGLTNKYTDAFFSNSVTIGTNQITARDRLTVGGCISVEEKITWYSKDRHDFYACMVPTSSNTFFQSYNAALDEFNINNKITITSNAANIMVDTNVHGIMTANSFSSPSDIKLKNNIRSSDSVADLHKLLQVDICDFNYKSSPGFSHKGVIAQELEKVIPEAVYENQTIMPSICKWSRFRTQNSIYFPHTHGTDNTNNTDNTGSTDNTNDLLLGIHIGDTMRLIYNDRFIDVLITNISEDGEYFVFSPDVVFDSDGNDRNDAGKSKDVLLYGLFNTYKMVNYDYLFAMCINALKCIHMNKT